MCSKDKSHSMFIAINKNGKTYAINWREIKTFIFTSHNLYISTSILKLQMTVYVIHDRSLLGDKTFDLSQWQRIVRELTSRKCLFYSHIHTYLSEVLHKVGAFRARSCKRRKKIIKKWTLILATSVMLQPVDPILCKSSLIHNNVCCLFCSRSLLHKNNYLSWQLRI